MQVPFVGFQPVKTSDHMAMGVWVAATGRLHRAGSLARFVEGVPVLVASCFGRDRYRQVRRNCGLGTERSDHSLDRPILLILGHWLCQEVGVSSPLFE